MLHCQPNDNGYQRAVYKDVRKIFDNETQRSKRLYQQNEQIRLENLDVDNPNEFWREIGRIV